MLYITIGSLAVSVIVSIWTNHKQKKIIETLLHQRDSLAKDNIELQKQNRELFFQNLILGIQNIMRSAGDISKPNKFSNN